MEIKRYDTDNYSFVNMTTDDVSYFIAALLEYHRNGKGNDTKLNAMVGCVDGLLKELGKQ